MAASSGAETGSAEPPPPAGPGPRSVSFGFSLRAPPRRLLRTAPGAGSEADEREFLTAVEDRELLSARPAPPPPEELVIPLLPSRRWRGAGHAPRNADHAPKDADHAPKDAGHAHEDRDHAPEAADPAPGEAGHAPGRSSPAPQDPAPSVESQAVQEILEETRQVQAGAPPGPPLAIPMAPPEREVTEGPMPGPQDYAAVPVAAFGLALLRGMGWRQGQPIGKTFARVVKPLEPRLRPRGLGLGASLAPPPPGAPSPNAGAGPGGAGPEVGVGATVRLESGPHRGQEGTVLALLPEVARAIVRLRGGDQTVTVSQHQLRARPPRDKAPQSPPPPTEAAPDAGAPEPKRKAPPPPRVTREGPRWLRRDLRVRCIAGRHFGSKLVVEDVVSGDTCVCRTESGQLVEGLREAMLETVIPRGDGDRVMVVLGEQAGQVGRILERDPSRGRALVQLGGGRLLALPYDALCHYVGGAEDD
ncbi:G-patch domain and KOW motifs-containing protein [Eudromia elegans]